MKPQSTELEEHFETMGFNRSLSFKVDDSKKYFAVCSGKGGVGKSNLVSNLAACWADRNLKVLVFDADFGLANQHILFGVQPPFDLSDVVSGRKDLVDVIYRTKYGVDLIAGANGNLRLAEIIMGELWAILLELKNFKHYDRILIDLGAGISDNALNLMRISDYVILVTTPEPTSVVDGFGLLKSLARNGIELPIQTIINRSYSLEVSHKVFKTLKNNAESHLAQTLDLFGVLFNDEELVKSVYAKKPLFFHNSQALFIKQLMQAVSKLELKISSPVIKQIRYLG